MIRRLLGRLFTPRDWVIVEDQGYHFAVHRDCLRAIDKVIQRGLTEDQAFTRASAQRHRADNTPQDVI